MKRFALVALATLIAVPVSAVSTKYWIHDTASEFLRGDAHGVSVTSDGSLQLAPRSKVVGEPDAPYQWDIVRSGGDTYVGTGDDGWVLRIHDGVVDGFFQCAALEVLALEVGADGTIYAGTAPEGFVYAVNEQGEGEILFDAEEEYIWDLKFGPDGHLYAAVGPTARVYRIDPKNGKAETFVEIEDNHVVCLSFDDAGNLLLGTEGRGLVVRVDRDGRPSVLHDTPQGEVGAVIAGADGVVWAAAAATAESREDVMADSNGDGTGLDDSSMEYSFEFTPLDAGNGVLYRIDADGNAIRHWESGQGTIFDLILDANGDVIVATGEEGALFAVHADGMATLLLDADEDQIVALTRDGGFLYAATANPSRVIRLGSGFGRDGTYESRVINARRVSRWGRAEWTGDTSAGGRVTLAVRTGNTDDPDATWTDWRDIGADGAIGDSRSRYLQWRVTLSEGGKRTPIVHRVRISSLENNLPPVITSVEVVPSGNRFYDESPDIRPRPLYQVLPGGVKVQYSYDNGGDDEFPTARRAPWTQGIRQVQWEAEDPNEDELIYDLSFRREDETRWKDFAEEVPGRNWSFNSRGVPDGRYRIRVTASDRPANPKGELSASRVSEPFIVDNSSPRFRDLKHQRSGPEIRISGRVEDEWSDIVRLEYSVNGSDWQDQTPRDGIFDSRTEDLEMIVEVEPGEEHSILLRGTDLAGNLSTARVLIKP